MALQQIELLLAGVRDTSGNVLSAGKVYTYAAGTLTPKATYVDANGVTAATNPIVLDSAGRAQVYGDGAYKLVVDTAAGANIYSWDNLYFARVTSATSQWPDIYGGTSTGSASVYSITVPLAVSSYSAGQEFRFIANHDTTGATATLNVNSAGPINLVKGPLNAALVAGDITSGDLVSVIYDSASGGRFKVTSIASSLAPYPLTLDRTTGRVGINSPTPGSGLDVRGAEPGGVSGISQTRYDSNNNPVALRHYRSKSATLGTNTAVEQNDNLGMWEIRGADGTDFPIAARILAKVGAAVSTGVVPGAFIFSVANASGVLTDRATINSAGEFLTGGTTDNGAFNLQCNGTGVWGAGAYTNGSDAALKEDIQPISETLDIVKSLNPVVFRYKESFSNDRNLQPGFIAQELQAALASTDYKDGIVSAGPTYLNVAYQTLIPVLVKAIQELTARLEALENAA